MALSLCSPSWEGTLTNGLSSQTNDYIHHSAGDNGSTLPLTAGDTLRLLATWEVPSLSQGRSPLSAKGYPLSQTHHPTEAPVGLLWLPSLA